MREYKQGKLVLLLCDGGYGNCEQEIAPNPDINNLGWRTAGIITEGNLRERDQFEWIYCPNCWDKNGWKYETDTQKEKDNGSS
jgi:hypothetical protein